MKVFKKSLAVLLTVMMLFSVMAVAVSAADEGATWIVAGSEGLCGSNWDAADAANALTLGDDGLYTKTYASVAEGNYEFKITNGTWDESYGDGDANVVFQVTAVCDVTIKFNPETKEVSYEGEFAGEPAPDASIVPGYYGVGSSGLFGIEDDWKTSPDERTLLTLTVDGYYYRDFANVAAGEYSFKVIYINNAGTVFWHPDLEPDSKVTVEEDGSTVRVIFVPVGEAEENVSGYREKPEAEVYAPGVVPPALEEYKEPTTDDGDDAVVEKKANPMKVSGNTVKVKLKKAKKAKQTFTAKKAFTFKKTAKGTVTYKKTGGDSKLSINKKTGKITLKKVTKAKTYKINVKVTAAGNKNFKKASKTVTVKVKVTK